MIQQIEYRYCLEMWKGVAKKLDLGSNSNPKMLLPNLG